MIELEPHEKFLFEKLDNIIMGLSEEDDIHVSGGWVRDKLLGKQSLDIDLVLKKKLVENFCNHFETMLKQNIIVMSEEQYIEYENNPQKKRDQENLTCLNRQMHIITQKPLDGIAFHCIVCQYQKDQTIVQFKIDVRQYYEDDIKYDCKARDFTINALYYSLKKKQIIDLVGVIQQGIKRFIRQNTKSS